MTARRWMDHGTRDSIALLIVHGLRAEPAVLPLVFHGSGFGRLRSV